MHLNTRFFQSLFGACFLAFTACQTPPSETALPASNRKSTPAQPSATTCGSRDYVVDSTTAKFWVDSYRYLRFLEQGGPSGMDGRATLDGVVLQSRLVESRYLRTLLDGELDFTEIGL